jgi:uncharacterized protein
MPGGASKLRDVRKLSDGRAIVESDIPLAELPGLPIELVCGGGPLHVQVQFGREQGFMIARVALRGELQLICQRCMGPMSWPVDATSSVLLIESEAEADGAPAEWETYLAADGRIAVGALAAEELLLALPIVPSHASGAECGPIEPIAAPTPAAAAEEPEMARPFADLRALLEQGTKRKS